jgi:hypothetical protein
MIWGPAAAGRARGHMIGSLLRVGRSLGPCHAGPSEATLESQQNVGAQLEMTNELERDRAMAAILESLEPPIVLVSMRPRPIRQVRQTRSEDHVSGHSDCTFPA